MDVEYRVQHSVVYSTAYENATQCNIVRANLMLCNVALGDEGNAT